MTGDARCGEDAFIEALAAAPMLPVLTIAEVKTAAPVAQALQRAGIRVAEVTLRTPAALAAIAAMRSAAPGLLVGAGTVLDAVAARAAVAQGADFLVTPGATAPLARVLRDSGVPAIPGVATVSEAMARREEGFRVLKLFPAAAVGGPRWLQAVAAPLPDLRFIPTGGVAQRETADYLALANVLAVGGSWMVASEDIAAGAWDRIETKTRLALAVGGEAGH